ncbi:MAG: type II secretion system F family protein [Oligoflexia bacterium]|nr:type II secretion system F family protein [Oligoflexia bacterium]
MSEYTYQGVDRKGQKVTGRVEAPTEGDLRMILRTKGIRPTRIERGTKTGEGGVSRPTGGSIRGVPNEIVVLFTRQLQLLISSGVPLLQSITILHEQSHHAVFKKLLGIIKERVSQGSYFWETLAPYPLVFPRLYTALVRAGESSGSLDQMLKRLTKYLEDAEKMKRMLKSAMMYPIIVISIGVGVISLMLIFVIPKFESMLASSGQELPAFTKAVIDTSHFFVNNAVPILGGIVAAVYMLIRYVRTPEGKAVMDRIFYRIPLFGGLMQKAGVARFCRTLQTLLMSGVNIIDAIDICRATIDNAVIEEPVRRVRAEVESGKTLGMVMSKYDVFPKMAVQMIQVGESTGNMDKMLEKIADFYDTEVEIIVGGMSKLIEPFILVFLGGTVGGLMIAMYLPIFKLAGGAGE